MTPEDLSIIHQVAEQKMKVLSQTTQKTYRRYLHKWERYTRKTPLIEYDVAQVGKWHARNKDRNAAFPVRCVEMVQAIAPDRVSPDFFIPQGLWGRDAFHYREKVIPAKVIAKMVECAIQDIQETTALTRETVIPFLVLMAIRSGMNVESLLHLRRDCCSKGQEHYVLRWFKGRSGGQLEADYFPMPWGPREIVRRVCELTADQSLLWVVSDSKERPFISVGSYLRVWCQRHQMRYFQLREIRPAMATLLYEETGDILAVKKYLHHTSVATTILYLAEYAVLPRAEEDIANALDNIARKAGLL